MLQRRGRIVDCAQARGEGGTILDRHRRALAHERVHWMASVTEQGRAAGRPVLKRIAVEQGPDEAGLGCRDDGSDLLVPALEGGERPRDSGTIRPILAVPAVVLGPADKIEEPPSRDEVVHEMGVGADPGLRAYLEPEISDAFGRHE